MDSMPVTLTVFDGTQTIGGNKILLEDRGTAVFLDFGMSFATRALYFEEFLAPRSRTGLLDPVDMGLIPPLRGIYRRDMEDPAGRVWERARRVPYYREARADAVLLSHAHMDHVGYISFLDADLPIISSVMTAYLAKAIQDCGADRFENEMSYAVPRIAAKDGTIGAAPPRDFPYVRRPYLLADRMPADNGEFWNLSPATKKGRHFPQKDLTTADRVGGLRLRYFPVDHSIYGADAIAVDTSAGWVVYTGDLRRHGRNKAATEAFIREANALRPIALISEGTNIDRGPGPTEAEAFASCLQAVQEADGEFVVADFGPRNVERLLAFLEIAERTSRRLAIADKDAYLLTAMHAADPATPTPASDPRMVVYRRALLKPDNWVNEVRAWYPNQVVAADVGRHPGDYIACFSFFDITELIDIDPKQGVWIYSSSEPHDEEQIFELERLKHWLARFNLKPVGLTEGPSPYHSSGHISGPELAELIRQIHPRRLIPVHTLYPDRFLTFSRDGIEVTLPELGTPILLDV